MKDSAVKYAVRGLIKATHVALSKGRENEDSIGELKDQLPDLVTEEFGNFDMSEAVSEQLSDYGIYSEDWKDDIKDDIASALAESSDDLSRQQDAHGNLITDVTDKVETIEATLADKVPYLEATLETVAGTLGEMESAYCDMPATVEAFEEEARLQEERIGSLERKLEGLTSTGFVGDMSDLIDAVQKLYELNGMALNFDLGGE
mgnify:FL=1